MNILKKKLEVLKEGADDTLDLLGNDEMDMILGGATCKKGYYPTKCTCGYEGGDFPTPSPTSGPTRVTTL